MSCGNRAVARMEHVGVPIDTETLSRLRAGWDAWVILRQRRFLLAVEIVQGARKRSMRLQEVYVQHPRLALVLQDKSRCLVREKGRLGVLNRQGGRETAAEAKIGITRMDWAVADTGTLADDSTSVGQRLASSLPIIHMALIETGRILPDMPSFLMKINAGESGYLSMITGPSRTADIERVLTIGVHGPERLVIVFVDEPGGLGQ